MRITNEIRKTVFQQITKKVFQQKLDNIATAMVAVIDDVATNFHMSEHNRAVALGAENEDLLIAINHRFTIENFKFKLSGFELLNKEPFNANRWGYVRSKELKFFTSRAKAHISELHANSKEIAALTKLTKQFESLQNEYSQFVTDMNAILAACNTKKKLLEVLPEAESHMPEQPKRLPVPVDKAKAIRAKIKKAA